MKPRHPNKVWKRFFLKFQNIIRPVANSGVIRKITFEIQYNLGVLDYFV